MRDFMADRIAALKAGKLTKSQKILLEYFELGKYEDIIYMSITQLAEATGVAEATVLRFCRSLGFDGYQEFKLFLAQNMVPANKNSCGAEYVDEIISNYQTDLEYSRTKLSSQQIDRAIDMILSARAVCFCGAGHSYLAALEMHNCLMKMGLLTYCEQDMHMQNILVSSRSAEDLLVIFSVSGGTKDVIEVAEQARSVGMKIVLITCYEKSPVSRLADLVVVCAPKESPAGPGAISSTVMQFFIIDVICEGIRLRDTQRFDALIARGNAATSKKLV